MNNLIAFTVPGVPVAQPRAKATTANGYTRVYTPESRKGSDGKRKSNGVAEFKALLKLCAADAYSRPPLTGPLEINCRFIFPRHSNKFWKSRPMPRYWHVTRPDRDNLDKMILDSLKGVLFVDDTQVCAGRLEKWCASGDEQPHVEIEVRVLES